MFPKVNGVFLDISLNERNLHIYRHLIRYNRDYYSQ